MDMRLKKFRTVSVQRSGNNLLLRYLHEYYFHRRTAGQEIRRNYLPDDFDIPTFAGRSHDQHLTEPRIVPGLLTVIQYRQPMPALLSRAERAQRKDNVDFASAGLRFAERWAAAQAAYFIAFCNKWLSATLPSSLLVPYDDLVSAPVPILHDILAKVGEEIDQTSLDKALRTVSGITFIGKVPRPFAARDPASSELIPLTLARLFDTYVRRATPWAHWNSPAQPVDETELARFGALVEQAKLKLVRKTESRRPPVGT